MYSSSSILALRAKWSFSHRHLLYSNDGASESCRCRCRCRCCCCGLMETAPPSCTAATAGAAAFSAHSLLVNPSFFYGYWLRQSTLIRWSPSRRFVYGGASASASAARYSRLMAACDLGRGPPKRRGWRWRQSGGAVGGDRVSCRVRESDGSFQEMLGLLEEVEECWRESAGTGEGWDYKRVSRKEDSSGEGDLELRRSGSSSTYYSAVSSSSFSGDSGDGHRKRVTDESLSGHGKEYAVGEKEFREVRKYGDEARAGRSSYGLESSSSWERDSKRRESRIGEQGEKAASSFDLSRQERDEYAQKDRRVTGQRESREGSQNLTRTSQLHGSSSTERASTSKKQFDVRREETSSVSVELLEEVRRQRIELEQLRKVYQELLRTTEARYSDAVRESSSSKVFKMRVEDREECDTSTEILLEEVRRQRSEIDQLRKSYQKLMRTSEIHESDMERASSSKKVTNRRLEDREVSSTSAVNLAEEVGEQCDNMCQKVVEYADLRRGSQKLSEIDQSRKNYRKHMKTSEINESGIDEVSSSKKVINTRLEASSVNFAEEVRVQRSNMDRQFVGYADSRNSQKLTEVDQLRQNHQKLTRLSEIHDSDIERISGSRKVLNTRLEDREASSTSDVNLVEEVREQQSNVDQQIIGCGDMRRSSKKLTEIAEIHNSNTEDALRSQRLFETRVKEQEINSASVQDLVQVTRKKITQTEHQVVENSDESNRSHVLIDVSEIHRDETDRATSSKKVMARIDDQEDNLASVYGSRDQQHEAGGQVRQQLRLRQDSQKNSKMLQLFESDTKRSSTSLKSSNASIKRVDDSSSLQFPEANEKQKGTLVEEKRSPDKMSLEAFSGTSDGGSSSVDTHILDDRAARDESHLVEADVLESVSRLDKSSSQYVGEFVDQLRQEISASGESNIASRHSSEIQMEAGQMSPLLKQNVLDAMGKYKGENCEEEGPRQSSARSEVKGSSDEMWDVGAPSSQEPPPAEEPEKDSSNVGVLESTGAPANIRNAIVKRSSRSLWSYIADIVRMGWRSHAEPPKSTLQSGTRSSSNESVSSDAWFSGHEPDDDEEENAKKGKRATQKETMLFKRSVDQSQMRISSAPNQGYSEATRLDGKITQVEGDMSILKGTNGSDDASIGSSLVPGLGNLARIEEETERQGIPSSVVTAGPSALLESTSVPISEEGTSIDKVQVQEVSIIKSAEEQITEKITEVGGNEGTDGDLRRRKLQRNKQVLREQFDEWEDTYRLENEQRKTDEIFMREALLEAKKAADMWEVPVGAVLVQDGRIIARGCNLVEELRDSTAHAEMICIREASNLLRTWRLAGTTVYVTLEPCAMCAGAILQARIGAVVWGAPNKLLGADGSWVRLFPGGDEGSSLDQSSQTAGPVHPFHPKITIRRGVLATECADAMQQFFQLRKNKKLDPPPRSGLPINYPAKLLTKMHDIFCMMSCM